MKEVQKNILENIFKAQIVEKNEFSMQTFSNIIDDVEICNLAFGDLGHKLFEIISEIDNDHPEVKYGKFLSSFNKEEFDNISGYLSLCKLANQNNLDFVISMFSKHITKSIFDAKNEIGFLKNRQNFVRLFKNKEVRDSLRKIKQTRPIGFTNVDKKLYELWQCDIDFSRFARFGNFYLEEIEIVNKKIDTYQSMGLNLLAKEIESSLADYQEKSDLNYYGFQRITVTIAALSLAKLHGYKLQVFNRISSIKVPANFYNFEGKSLLNYVPSNNDVWGGHVGLPVKLEDYDYMPLAIPLHDVEKIPDSMKKVINHLEEFPEAEYKPIFDHYLIISPGPKYPRINESSCDIFDKTGKKNNFSDPISAKKFLDNTLINEGYLTPILLGEKDGKCYFICFWEN